jgi:DNA-binding response OmpR family regulator
VQARRPVVLVVEDDAPTATMLRRLLTKADYAVESASDGASGLARIAQGGIDVVLLDVVLPDGSGLELCRQVRTHTEHGHLPIIMLTGLSSDSARRAGFAAGADDYITKPFHTADLLDRVRVWARARQHLQVPHERRREIALREQLVRDEALLAMTHTAIHEWARLSGLLAELLRLWEASIYTPEHVARLRSELQAAADDLEARVAVLRQDLRSSDAASSAN